VCQDLVEIVDTVDRSGRGWNPTGVSVTMTQAPSQDRMLKFLGLQAVPTGTVTVTRPVVVPEGTSTTILVAAAETIGAAIPLNETGQVLNAPWVGIQHLGNTPT
jgi:hypothetical protein